MLPADTALRIPKPARPILGVREPWPWWWWALIAAAVVALGLGIWWWMRRRRALATMPKDPYAEAKAAFARVERLRLIDAGEAGRYAALMTDVVRRYLSDRFDTVSLAQTSHELLSAVGSSPSVSVDSLRALLTAVEPVKFAAAPLSADRARGMGDEAKEIVHEEHTRAIALEAAADAASKERAA